MAAGDKGLWLIGAFKLVKGLLLVVVGTWTRTVATRIVC